MKEIYIGIAIAVLLWVLIVSMTGCTQTYYKVIPVRENSKQANCIRNNSDGTQSLAICPKQLKDTYGEDVVI